MAPAGAIAARPEMALDPPQDPPDSDATYAVGRPEAPTTQPASAQLPAAAQVSAPVQLYEPVRPVTARASRQVPPDSSATNSPDTPNLPVTAQLPADGHDTAVT